MESFSGRDGGGGEKETSIVFKNKRNQRANEEYTKISINIRTKSNELNLKLTLCLHR